MDSFNLSKMPIRYPNYPRLSISYQSKYSLRAAMQTLQSLVLKVLLYARVDSFSSVIGNRLRYASALCLKLQQEQ